MDPKNSTGRCRACFREIVFLKTVKGKWMPVNAETAQPEETIYSKEKGHISHFVDCPKAKEFKKKKGE